VLGRERPLAPRASSGSAPCPSSAASGIPCRMPLWRSTACGYPCGRRSRPPQRTAGRHSLGRAAPGPIAQLWSPPRTIGKFPCADDRAHLARQARAEIERSRHPGISAAKLRLQRDAPEHIGALSGKVRQQPTGKQLMRTRLQRDRARPALSSADEHPPAG